MSNTTNLALRPSKKLKRGADDASTEKEPATPQPCSGSSVPKVNVTPQSATADPPKEKPGNRGKRSLPEEEPAEEESNKKESSNRGKLTSFRSRAFTHITRYKYDVPLHPANKGFEAPPESYGHKVTFTTKPAPGDCPLPCHGYVVRWEVEDRPPPPTVEGEAQLRDLPKPEFPLRVGDNRRVYQDVKLISTNQENGERIFRLLLTLSSTDGLQIAVPDLVRNVVKESVCDHEGNPGKVIQVRYYANGEGPYVDLPCDPRRKFHIDVLVECGPTESFLETKELAKEYEERRIWS